MGNKQGKPKPINVQKEENYTNNNNNIQSGVLPAKVYILFIGNKNVGKQFIRAYSFPGHNNNIYNPSF